MPAAPSSLLESFNKPPNSTVWVGFRVLQLRKQSSLSLNRISTFVDSLACRSESPPKNGWRFSGFSHDGSSSEFLKPEPEEKNISKEIPDLDFAQETDANGISNWRKFAQGAFFFLCSIRALPDPADYGTLILIAKLKHFLSYFSLDIISMIDLQYHRELLALTLISDFKHHEAWEAAFRVDPWVVPWTAGTIIQVMLLWIASFWLVGSWVIPFLAYAVGIEKESLTYRGQALYSLLTDAAEGVAGIAVLQYCLARFRPLPSDWFRFSLQGKWHIDLGLGCLMFPLVNHLSQVNLNLFPLLPSSPVTVSNVEQSFIARDPVAMALYAVVVSFCAPIWEEIFFRGFLLPSLTRYMPIWSSILVSSVAFALAHFSVQRMLPLLVLGMVIGAVFARSKNLFSSIVLHSLWNAFVFMDLLK